ncbi:hypothetical protein HPP92_016596, partial [Vanilla planifolia]
RTAQGSGRLHDGRRRVVGSGGVFRMRRTLTDAISASCAAGGIAGSGDAAAPDLYGELLHTSLRLALEGGFRRGQGGFD